MTGRQTPAGIAVPGMWTDFGGGREYLLPPLSLGALELMQKDLAELPTLSAIEPRAIATMIDATHAALRRNYPEISRQQVGELVDVANMGDVYERLMDVAGIKRRAEAAAGNVGAGASVLDGGASSPPLPPTPAGTSSTSAST